MQQGRSQRQKAPAGSTIPVTFRVLLFPFKCDDLAVLELFREESRLTLPAPAVPSSAQSVPYSWLYYNNNVATNSSPSFAAKIINYPSERPSIKETERPRHSSWQSLGNRVQKREDDATRRFVWSEKREGQGQTGGTDDQKQKGGKQDGAWQRGVFV